MSKPLWDLEVGLSGGRRCAMTFADKKGEGQAQAESLTPPPDPHSMAVLAALLRGILVNSKK